ncbi:unnamed protein product [Somion occarium]|uniref:Transposase n=1 Tax=Somion occarium TaxID=3059160 RepID=A0ABP1CPI1_9APHY
MHKLTAQYQELEGPEVFSQERENFPRTPRSIRQRIGQTFAQVIQPASTWFHGSDQGSSPSPIPQNANHSESLSEELEPFYSFREALAREDITLPGSHLSPSDHVSGLGSECTGGETPSHSESLELNMPADMSSVNEAGSACPSCLSPTADSVEKERTYCPPPSINIADLAYRDLSDLLRPHRPKGKPGYKDCALGDVLQRKMREMQSLLAIYVNGKNELGWIDASLQAAIATGHSTSYGRTIRERTRSFINDRHCLPYTPMATWNKSSLELHGLKEGLVLHLQSLGKYIRALDIVEFCAEPSVQKKYGLEKTICLSTAQNWMHVLEYRWSKEPTGQFVDGHERADVVDYRQQTFLPRMEKLDEGTRRWDRSSWEEVAEPRPRDIPRRKTVYWYHDESTFYAHDRRKKRWVHKSEKAVPQPKGEGVSLMVSDFVSADYGWLHSPDGIKSARVYFHAGKNREGYFTNEDICTQTEEAMAIVKECYPNEDHVFIFDNATTHLARAPDALSARHMSQKTTLAHNPMFGVEVRDLDSNGKPQYDRSGEVLKKKIKMGPATYADGSPQCLYYPPDHTDPNKAGRFKGMAVLLEERGYKDMMKLRAQCKGFKCPPTRFDRSSPCCCRRLLYNEPDFVSVESILETLLRTGGYQAVFLPKFHCELNFIEQCWGASKREYRKYPMSSSLEDLDRNVATALETVSVKTMRRFYTRSHRFMDAYRKGLTGKQAAWATKQYHGHRVLPNSILDELELKGIEP